MTVRRCPMCPWTARCYREERQAAAFADHIAGHSMLDAVLALIALQQRPPPVPCRKVGYPDQEMATKALLNAWRRRSPIRRETRAYSCQDCGYWHLTSKPAKEKVE